MSGQGDNAGAAADTIYKVYEREQESSVRQEEESVKVSYVTFIVLASNCTRNQIWQDRKLFTKRCVTLKTQS